MEILTREGSYNGCKLYGKLEETHISWVILSTKWAFKIKKPIQLAYLDFSTLALRKKFCIQELELNRRFSSIYLDVLPVRVHDGQWQIGGELGKVVDYSVRMKRLQSSKRMDLMLRQKKVGGNQIRALAMEVAAFHQNAKPVSNPFDLKIAKGLFNDLEDTIPWLEQEWGASCANQVLKSIFWSNSFLEKYKDRMHERVKKGYIRDVHGDLHSGNIFLYQQPILFDCIEFNEQFRCIDVLYEVAFLCMDLEAFGQEKLADIFLINYLKDMVCMDKKEDIFIFNYYKCLRANIRAKVHALSAQQEREEGHLEAAEKHKQQVKKYIDLMENYRSG